MNRNILFITRILASNWSRGMIPASGAGGPGFDSRIGPESFCSTMHFTVLFVLVYGNSFAIFVDFWLESCRTIMP